GLQWFISEIDPDLPKSHGGPLCRPSDRVPGSSKSTKRSTRRAYSKSDGDRRTHGEGRILLAKADEPSGRRPTERYRNHPETLPHLATGRRCQVRPRAGPAAH